MENDRYEDFTRLYKTLAQISPAIIELSRKDEGIPVGMDRIFFESLFQKKYYMFLVKYPKLVGVEDIEDYYSAYSIEICEGTRRPYISYSGFSEFSFKSMEDFYSSLNEGFTYKRISLAELKSVVNVERFKRALTILKLS